MNIGIDIDGVIADISRFIIDFGTKFRYENNINTKICENEYDGLEFTVGSKLPYCKKNNIDVMIDDSPTNVLDISTKIPVLCFDNPYNKTLNGNNITRVYGWYEILYKIENKEF